MQNLKTLINNSKYKIQGLLIQVNSKKKVIGSIFGVLVLTLSVAAGTYLVFQKTGKTKAAGVALSLSSSSANPNIGDIFTVAVVVNTNGLPIGAADIRVDYDTTKLQAQSITAGTFLPVVLQPGTIIAPATGTSGRAWIIVGGQVDQTGTYPKSGIGVLAQVTFKTLSGGSTDIFFVGGASQVAAIGQQSNVLDTTSPITIAIQGSTPSPVPTASPIATTPAPTLPPSTTLYKLLSPQKIVLLTANATEESNVLAAGWTLAASPFRIWASQYNYSTLIPVNRLSNATYGYFYTISSDEINNFVKAGWNNEGVAFYVSYSPAGTVPVYRLNKGMTFVYTASTQERDAYIAAGYTNNGVAFYALNP